MGSQEFMAEQMKQKASPRISTDIQNENVRDWPSRQEFCFAWVQIEIALFKRSNYTESFDANGAFRQVRHLENWKCDWLVLIT